MKEYKICVFKQKSLSNTYKKEPCEKKMDRIEKEYKEISRSENTSH